LLEECERVAKEIQTYAADGTYLGKLNANGYDPESIVNPYGQYGSVFFDINQQPVLDVRIKVFDAVCSEPLHYYSAPCDIRRHHAEVKSN
jgi:hypothetical protein